MIAACVTFSFSALVAADATSAPAMKTQRFADFRMRDACIVSDEATHTYYAVGPAGRGNGASAPAIRAYTSKDLVNWEGPRIIFETPSDFWGEVKIKGIWAPELHHYRDKWYIFATFDTDTKFPEQWRNWLPRVKRGTQILVSDSPFGPFKPFEPHSTLPTDMMTLDGTLWVEDGKPYMVFCHEWVQIKNGTVCYVPLKEDLSQIDGEPVRLFDGSDGPWVKKSTEYGCCVTDGPSLWRSKSGKLFMIWSSGGEHSYTTGVAISDSGKLAGPWRQQTEPLFGDDGGHGFIFRRFDGQLMMALHQPNKTPLERIHLFELEDTGETLRITREFPGQ